MGPSRYGHPESDQRSALGLEAQGDPLLNIDGLAEKVAQLVCAVVFYGQAERAISNGKLNVLLRLHIRPIKQVVFLCPS